MPERPARDHYATLRERYRASLPAKADELADLGAAAREARHDAASRAALADCVHRYAGSAAVYGFEALGALLAESERLLTDARAAPPDVVERRIAALVAALRAARDP